MNVFNLSTLKLVSFISVVVALLWLWANNVSLEKRLQAANELNIQTTAALEQANSNLKEVSEQFQAGLIALNALKLETKREKIYVEKVKERIIRDNNVSCIDSVNDVFGRLREAAASSKGRY